MTYCSDILNLQALYGADRSSIPRAKLVKVQADLANVEIKLERLTDVMLASKEGGIPRTFAKRARDLEFEQQRLKDAIQIAERDLSATARIDIKGIDIAWKRLAAGVYEQDYDTRMQTRQLVADTFECITIYHRGIKPTDDKGPMDMVLLAKGGTKRLLRIDRTGKLISSETIQELN
jgi:hypothetical protein